MWFEGKIQQALDKSKNEKIMLLTFIKGTNDDSVKMNNILDHTEFKNEIYDNVVALKFEETSENAKMFNQIYPFKEVPTVYLISSDAKVLDSLTGLIEKAVLIAKINAALDKQKLLKASENQPTNSSQKSKDNQLANANETLSLKRAANESPVKADTDLDPKEKERRAQELIKEIRVKKAKEEEQLTLDREKNRIRVGKELQTAKEIQQQKEMQDLIKQREREKLEEKRHRDQILAQIKQDQEDRKARFCQFENVPKKPLVISTPTQINSEKTRIQFRLPDSSTIKSVFNITDPLRTVIKYVEDNTSYRYFKLVTSIPKREFDDKDLDKTLIDLKLAPSAVLILQKPPAYPVNVE